MRTLMIAILTAATIACRAYGPVSPTPVQPVTTSPTFAPPPQPVRPVCITAPCPDL